MPHVIIEATSNLESTHPIKPLLRRVNERLVQLDTLIPIGGLRTRGYVVTNYVVADGTEDDAFVHVTVKLGGGRTDEQFQQIGDAIFQVVSDYYDTYFEQHSLALSLDLQQFQRPTWKKNNIHERYR
ncbi:MAG TPA: 5-carboxymethyl-2-hydroxymuconate isomerase [Savagea sp.]